MYSPAPLLSHGSLYQRLVFSSDAKDEHKWHLLQLFCGELSIFLTLRGLEARWPPLRQNMSGVVYGYFVCGAATDFVAHVPKFTIYLYFIHSEVLNSDGLFHAKSCPGK